MTSGEKIVQSGRAPLTDLVISVCFDRVAALKTSHIRLFWNSIRMQFPHCENAPGADSNDKHGDRVSALAGAWLSDDTGTDVVRIQNDYFQFNWRLARESGSYLYPGFAAIERKFYEVFEAFQAFVKNQGWDEIKPTAIELCYVNYSKQGEGWANLGEISHVLSILAWPSAPEQGSIAPPGMISSVFRVPLGRKNENLTIKVGTTKNIRNEVGGLSLELGIKMESVNMISTEIRKWLRHAHSTVNDAFELITTRRIRSYWGLP